MARPNVIRTTNEPPKIDTERVWLDAWKRRHARAIAEGRKCGGLEWGCSDCALELLDS